MCGDRSPFGGGQNKFGLSLLYDVPGNRYLAEQDSSLHQKSRRKVHTAHGGPESADRLSAGKVPAAPAAPMAPMAPMAPIGSERYGTVQCRYCTVSYRRYGTSTVRYGTVLKT